MHILIVEDETEIREVLAAYFRKEGWEVDMTPNGNEAFHKYDYKKHDLIVLDLKLEGLPGEKVCELIREKSNVPVIVLTSKSLESDVIHGLEIGADDYIVKPFRVKELVARIKAVMRRTSQDSDKPVTLSFQNGTLIIDRASAEVIIEGNRAQLTSTEFKLLSVLTSKPMKVFSRSDLLYQVLGYRFQDDSSRSLDVHIKNLRKKIEKDKKRPQFIQTVVGMGYRFGYEADQR
ncbi:response regulator [Marinicrinis lubricantis]|uniref:Response regulator n=1 Tax=Marinicrinis lubricantis TaxID=2086470 RepID=A0ABW1IVF3_9BACL